MPVREFPRFQLYQPIYLKHRGKARERPVDNHVDEWVSPGFNGGFHADFGHSIMKLKKMKKLNKNNALNISKKPRTLI